MLIGAVLVRMMKRLLVPKQKNSESAVETVESTIESSAKRCAFGRTAGINELLVALTVMCSDSRQWVICRQFSLNEATGSFGAISGPFT